MKYLVLLIMMGPGLLTACKQPNKNNSPGITRPGHADQIKSKDPEKINKSTATSYGFPDNGKFGTMAVFGQFWILKIEE